MWPIPQVMAARRASFRVLATWVAKVPRKPSLGASPGVCQSQPRPAPTSVDAARDSAVVPLLVARAGT